MSTVQKEQLCCEHCGQKLTTISMIKGGIQGECRSCGKDQWLVDVKMGKKMGLGIYLEPRPIRERIAKAYINKANKLRAKEINNGNN